MSVNKQGRLVYHNVYKFKILFGKSRCESGPANQMAQPPAIICHLRRISKAILIGFQLSQMAIGRRPNASLIPAIEESLFISRQDSSMYFIQLTKFEKYSSIGATQDIYQNKKNIYVRQDWLLQNSNFLCTALIPQFTNFFLKTLLPTIYIANCNDVLRIRISSKF